MREGKLRQKPEEVTKVIAQENPRVWNPVVRVFAKFVLEKGIELRLHFRYRKSPSVL